MIIDSLKQHRMLAMKNGNKVIKNVLSVVIADVERKQDTSDASCIKVIQSVIKNNNETLAYKPLNLDDLCEENRMLSVFLPKKMTGHELHVLVKSFCLKEQIVNLSGMGKVMGYLKQNYSDYLIDGNEVRQILQGL